MMSSGDTKKSKQQNEVEIAASIGSGKPEATIKNNKDSLANASRETRVNGNDED
jgi:hypothetical protein